LEKKPGFAWSVFKDNAGAIEFDQGQLFVFKVETHNSPSALDPYGGAITGIVGVNRDIIGFGLGALPVMNFYGYCFADPKRRIKLYKEANFKSPMLDSERIMLGVIEGVKDGGNQSGIPTVNGFMRFDERFRGKPLVFVGTGGIIPKEVNGRKMYEKKAEAGDYIMMVGGRVGLDGIHGATFSSEGLDEGSPASAVQIGDAITQKKLSDALIKEARDLGLYNSITDDGAGGLSSSVGEMAKESNGCYVYLDKVPLKYSGLDPWQIWISESQERMTLSVPKEKKDEFMELMRRRGVEATVIGEFNGSGKCVVEHSGKKVVDLDLDFLHNGLPKTHQKSSYTGIMNEEPELPKLDDLTESLHSMLARLNMASNEFISTQYDHEVQAGSVLKPLQGRGRVNADTTVTRPLLTSRKAIAVSYGLNPNYSDIDTYQMAASSIDTAVRNAIAAGANPEKIALLDNFCWASSEDPEMLGRLKEAARACYEIATAYGTPFVSGKDSMFNDFKGFDESGKPIKISIPPTLLTTAIGVVDEATKSVSIDAKNTGDLIYVIGSTYDELGGSEYFAMKGEEAKGKAFIGNSVPIVDAARNMDNYRALARCIDEELIASATSVHIGGLGVALSRMAMAGKLGIEASLDGLTGSVSSDEYALFSESQGRIVVTVSTRNQRRFEEMMVGKDLDLIGSVRADDRFIVNGLQGSKMIDTGLDRMLLGYRKTFEGY
jgi:phosphoribosylformylglycinamidine synthase